MYAPRPVICDARPLDMRTYRLAGPTCDLLDTLFEMRSPVEPKASDRLVLKTAGAYVYSLSSPFNGFPCLMYCHQACAALVNFGQPERGYVNKSRLATTQSHNCRAPSRIPIFGDQPSSCAALLLSLMKTRWSPGRQSA